jgi:hypothetical protein
MAGVKSSPHPNPVRRPSASSIWYRLWEREVIITLKTRQTEAGIKTAWMIESLFSSVADEVKKRKTYSSAIPIEQRPTKKPT